MDGNRVAYDEFDMGYDPEPIPCDECGQDFWSWTSFDRHLCD